MSSTSIHVHHSCVPLARMTYSTHESTDTMLMQRASAFRTLRKAISDESPPKNGLLSICDSNDGTCLRLLGREWKPKSSHRNPRGKPCAAFTRGDAAQRAVACSHSAESNYNRTRRRPYPTAGSYEHAHILRRLDRRYGWRGFGLRPQGNAVYQCPGHQVVAASVRNSARPR